MASSGLQAVLSVVCSLALGGAASADDDPGVDSAEAVRGRCFSCHDETRLRRLAARAPEADRAARLARFLPTHFQDDPSRREAVIAWLLSVAGR